MIIYNNSKYKKGSDGVNSIYVKNKNRIIVLSIIQFIAGLILSIIFQNIILLFCGVVSGVVFFVIMDLFCDILLVLEQIKNKENL